MSCAHAIEVFNKAYAEGVDGNQLPVRPSSKLAIITCMVRLPSICFLLPSPRPFLFVLPSARTWPGMRLTKMMVCVGLPYLAQ